MEIQHYSHQHKLIFSEDQNNGDDDDIISCHLCEKPIMGTANYNCSGCNFFLHKTCAELPNKVWHRFHRQHQLTLCLQDPETCYICKTESKDLFYICKNCNFTIDTKCASSSSWKQASSHQHRFILLKRPESFRCDACGIECDLSMWSSQPYLCTLCHIVVHDYCRFVTPTISITQHHHPLTHTYMVVQENEALNCIICHTEVSTSYGSYYCQECWILVHVKCALRNIDVSEHPVVDECAYQLPIRPETEEFGLDEEELPLEIDHFSHPHKLAMCDEIDYDHKYYCDGCILPINTTFYKCEDCDFMLHATCTTQLPESIKHWLHSHTLTLLPKSSGADGTFSCSACLNICHGFSYCCDECSDCTICARCVSVPFRFKHAGHEHVLSFVQETNCIPCNACGSCETSFLFQCRECSFVLRYQCATLPATIKRTRDARLYTLAYHQSTGIGLDCDLCKRERDPKHWFYYCAEFDLRAHLKCVLGNYPYLKMRT